MLESSDVFKYASVANHSLVLFFIAEKRNLYAILALKCALIFPSFPQKMLKCESYENVKKVKT